MSDTSNSPARDPARIGAWLKGVLLASLMLNLVIVGAIAGRTIFHRPWGGHGAHDRLGIMEFARGLPSDRQQVVRDFVRAERPRMRPLRQEARAARRELGQALAAEQLDRTGVDALAEKVAGAELKVRLEALRVLVDLAGKLTPAERAAYARWLERHDQRRNRRHDGTGDGPGKD